MRIAVTLFGLDVFTFEVDTDGGDDRSDVDRGDVGHYQRSGFELPEREGGSPDLVR